MRVGYFFVSICFGIFALGVNNGASAGKKFKSINSKKAVHKKISETGIDGNIDRVIGNGFKIYICNPKDEMLAIRVHRYKSGKIRKNPCIDVEFRRNSEDIFGALKGKEEITSTVESNDEDYRILDNLIKGCKYYVRKIDYYGERFCDNQEDHAATFKLKLMEAQRKYSAVLNRMSGIVILHINYQVLPS